jgi:ribonuclease P protein component
VSGSGKVHPLTSERVGALWQVPGDVADFRRHEHIRRRAEFQQVYERGTRVHGRLTTLFILANKLSIGRLGIAATKRLGGAVERNRAKRLIREVFRRHKIAPGFDVVVIPRRELLDASLAALEIEYRRNIERSLRQPRRSG